jgi:hypothetical protein
MGGPLDYTNIIGKKFSNFVIDQLKARTKILNNNGDTSTERSNADLMWLTNRNGWLRVTSNVDVRPGADGGPLAKAYGAGDTLAKKYVLQGGVVYADAKLNNGSVLRSGVGLDKAYGVGYNPNSTGDMGLKPMPGITGFSITCDGPYGALKTANIKIKAWDIEQFNIIETLYCHLGYSLVVEFGHIPYINNSGVLQTQIKTLPVFTISGKEELAIAMSKLQRESCGNYDALFGTVTNYSWTANPDGSYDIDLKVIGPGSIVESLTINYTTSKVNALASPSQLPIYKEFLENSKYKAADAAPEKPAGTPDELTTEDKINIALQATAKDILPGVIASRNNSIIHKHLFAIYEHALTEAQVQNKLHVPGWWESIWKSTLSFGLTNGAVDIGGETAIAVSTDARIAGQIFAQNKTYEFLNISGNSLSGDPLALKGNNSWLINHPEDAGKVKSISPTLFSIFVIAYLKSPKQENSGKDSTTKDQLPSVYIPLGYFLAILQSSGMLYNSKKGDTKGKKTRPFIYLDFNDKTNFCYARDYSFSVDPSICLVNLAGGDNANTKLFGGVKSSTGEEILPNTLFELAFSPKYEAGADLLSPKITEKKLDFYHQKTAGYPMHILMNIEYLVNKIDSLAGDDVNKEVKIDKLLNDILMDINNSMGGVNLFRVAFEDDSYCIRIMDEQRLDDGNGQPEPYAIDVLGLSSLVKTYSLTSKMTPKLAAMLVIAAQASSGSNKKAAAVNASAVAKWNEFVADRIAPSKVDSAAGDEKSPGKGNAAQKATDDAAKDAAGDGAEGEQQDSPDQQLAKHMKGIYCTFRYNAEDVEACRNTLSEKVKAIQANEEESEAAAMIPLEFTLKMDGISGILVNQTFVIPPERLPISYQDKTNPAATKLGFIVRKIENTIENNQWITSISGQSLNLTNSVMAPVTKITTGGNKFEDLKKNEKIKEATEKAPKDTLDPTKQKIDNEKTSKVVISESGKNITANTYTWIPKNAPKSVDVFIFYPGIIVGNKVGRDYMPQKVKAGVPDWFDKYVLVFPTRHTTSYTSVKKEVDGLLAKAGLTQRTLNIGIYSGSGNGDASVLQAVKNAGKELRTFIMMDPTPSATLQSAVKARQAIGGTFQHLWYHPYWGGADYYGGKGKDGKLYGNISLLVPLLKNAYETDKGHYDIPAAMLAALKSQIEQGLG